MKEPQRLTIRSRKELILLSKGMKLLSEKSSNRPLSEQMLTLEVWNKTIKGL